MPLEHLAEYVDRLTEVFARHGTRGTWYAHASVGTLHVRPILDMRRDGAAEDARDRRGSRARWCASTRARSPASTATASCAANGSRWQFGPRLTRAFEEIKALFDPAGTHESRQDRARVDSMDDRSLFRFRARVPDRCRSTPRSTGRRGTSTTMPLTETVSRAGHGRRPGAGFAKAVEMCNNNGHCRKFDAGTMCPSFRVTRDEVHLTRGRANTLRLALSGQLGRRPRVRAAVREALDLCVSCKGCRRECPTGVDMAKMKIEFLHHWQRSARPDAQGPRRSPTCRAGRRGRRGCLRSPTCAKRVPRIARAIERCARNLARAARCRGGGDDTFLRDWREPAAATDEADVVLFVDTFTQLLRARERARGAGGAARGRLSRRGRARTRRRCAARATAVLRPHLPRRGPRRRGEARGAADARRARARGRARRDRSSGSSRRACSRCVTSSWSMRPRRGRAAPGRRRRCSSRSSSRASTRRAACAFRWPRCRRDACAAARPLPPEGVRCDAGGAGGAAARARARGRAGRVELLRHGRAASATMPRITTCRCEWPSSRCCRPCATPPRTRCSWPTARAAATRSPTAPAAGKPRGRARRAGAGARAGRRAVAIPRDCPGAEADLRAHPRAG